MAEWPNRRRVLMLGALSGVGLLCMPARGAASVSPERFGATAASGNDTEALVRALEFCRTEGGALVLGNRPYFHDGNLVTRGVSVYGAGERSELVALDPSASALIVRGAGVTVANFIKSSPHARIRGTRANGIVFDQATDFTMRAVDVVGSRGAGVVVRGGRGGTMGPGVRVRDTLADGVHLTNGARDIVIRDVECSNNGDDSFAVVSYRAQGRLCRNIRFVDCRSRDSRARGFAVVGGRSVEIVNPRVERSAAAGLYFYSERSYDTYGVADCRAVGGALLGCVADEDMTGYSVITMGGRADSDVESGERFTRECVRCTVEETSIDGIGMGAAYLVSAGRFTRECMVRVRTSSPTLTGRYDRPVRDLGTGNTIVLS